MREGGKEREGGEEEEGGRREGGRGGGGGEREGSNILPSITYTPTHYHPLRYSPSVSSKQLGFLRRRWILQEPSPTGRH